MSAHASSKPPTRRDYQLVAEGDESEDERGGSLEKESRPHITPDPPKVESPRRRTIRFVVVAFVASAAVLVGLKLAWDNGAASRLRPAGGDCPCQAPSDVPQYFQTSPQLWPGPTATGKAPFLAQTRTFDPTGYTPNGPLQTSIPVQGMKSDNGSIFKLMGYVPHCRLRIDGY